MSFLILDTDKQSTGSLRMQLDAIGDIRVREASEASAYARLRSRRLPPPDVIFIDEDGDPERVEAFRHELELEDSASVVVYLGTQRNSRRLRSFDGYLRKPVFRRKLELAMVQGYARGQARRQGLGYLGFSMPPELVRALPHSGALWKQFLPVQVGADLSLLARVGAVFVSLEDLDPASRIDACEWLRKLRRFTSASRIFLVGIGNSPDQTHDLRNIADYFVSADCDWTEVLNGLANRRLHRLRSELALKRARDLLAHGNASGCKRGLEKIVNSDPWNLTGHGRLADLAFSRKKYRSAELGYRRILELNPCQPRAHLRILEIEKRTNGTFSKETLERARRYCPKVPAIQHFEAGNGQ